jgi:hypothetical protein
MNFAQFKREVALAARGAVPNDVARIERALHRKECLQCAQALNQFAAACLEVQPHGEPPRRLLPPSAQLPPLA